MDRISKHNKIIWSIRSIILLGVLTNAIIIIAACINMPNLFWVLLITMPLLIVGIVNTKETNHILSKYYNISRRLDSKQEKLELLPHSIYPNKIYDSDLKVLIGNEECRQPYNAFIFNIDSLKNTYPKKTKVQVVSDQGPDYLKNSCEETLCTYSLGAKDLVWQIGPTYIGCRTANGNFNSKVFKENAGRPEVKMIELILSTAIKSACTTTDSSLDIVNTINPKINNRIFSGKLYSTFREAEGMIHFLDSLRELSGKKPIGIRLCIRDKKELCEICHAIRKTQLIPDFIVVEGSFESSSTVHKGIHTEMPLYEALLFVSQTLQIYGLETKIKIIASGPIISSFDILRLLALGANAVCAKMPDYSTKDGKTFSLYKGQNLNDFRNYLLKATVQAMKVCGFMNVGDITLSNVFRRLDISRLKAFEKLNGPISHPGIVKKINTSKIKSYESQGERNKVQI